MPFNSTIKYKQDYCIDCNDGVLKPCVAKRCKARHYRYHRNKVALQKRIAVQAKANTRRPARSANPLRKAWFADRGEDMTGFCANCGGPSCKGHPKYEKYSACHIFPKAYFKSIQYHPLNFIELCHFDMSCHTNMDNGGVSFMVNMKCWSVLVSRFRAFEHLITQKERARKFYKEFKRQADLFKSDR